MGTAIDCHYSVEGQGPPLILIHGIGAARDAWRFMVEDLSKHFSVVRYDLRGHGISPAVPPGFGLDALVDDLERVRQACGFESVHLAGHSLGGMIAPAYARQFPDRVKSMSLLSTAAFRTAEDRAKVLAVVEAMEAQGIANILPTLSDRWFTDDFIQAHPDIVERRMAQVIATNAETFLTVFRIYATTEMQAWLESIDTPSLVLTGEFDGGCPPRLNQQIAQALPNAELVILRNLKHAILLESPEAVTTELIRFVSQHN